MKVGIEEGIDLVKPSPFFGRLCRRAAELRETRNGLALIPGTLFLLWRIAAYPADYLFVPDREILLAQIVLWFELIVPALAITWIASRLLSSLERRLLARNAVRTGVLFGDASRRASAALDSAAAPWVLAFMSMLAMFWSWVRLGTITAIHDEAAYLLQAQLLASGRWAGKALPLPEFFEQMYVFASPFHASKYPPGFPLALVPGIWIHFPLLGPLLLFGATAGLLFSLTRRVTNAWIGLFAWLLWTTERHFVTLAPPFMSQWLTGALWLVSWWLFLRWREQHEIRFAVAIGVAIGWGAITRPLTAAAAAVPIGVLLIAGCVRRREIRSLIASALAALGVLAFLPLWNHGVTGDWKTSPLVLNVRQNTPYDGLGFGRVVPPRTRLLPPDLAKETRVIGLASRHHEWRDIPETIKERTRFLLWDTFSAWRLALCPLALIAVLWAPPEAGFAVVTVGLDFALYLLFPHPSRFALYYLEVHPVFAFLAAIGLWRLLAFFFGGAGETIFPSPTSRHSARGASIGFVAAFFLIPPALEDLATYRNNIELSHGIKKEFRREIDRLPAGRKIIFVRYSPFHAWPDSLVENGPDLDRQDAWLVHDRGKANHLLTELAPDRRAYLYDEARGIFVPLEKAPADYPAWVKKRNGWNANMQNWQ